MRNSFAEELENLAEEHNTFLLSGDIGNRLFDKYKEKFPRQFLNCGVAEQNMIGISAGLALNGFKPIAYTITSFLTLRCFEQIKIDLCYHNLPVILVGVGSGLCYSKLGATHHSLEDIGILRTLPNMTIICPGDPLEVKAAFKAALKHDGPVYIRLAKKGEPLIHKQEPILEIGKPLILNEGKEICILSTGNMLSTNVQVSNMLKEKGISTQSVSFHTIKPINKDFLDKIFSKFKIIVTLEEHNLIGGLGSTIAEWLSETETDKKSKLMKFGVPDCFTNRVGDQAYLRNLFGLSSEQIFKNILEIYQN